MVPLRRCDRESADAPSSFASFSGARNSPADNERCDPSVFERKRYHFRSTAKRRPGPAPAVASDFDLSALYDALDQQRQARGLTWLQVRREINAVGSAALTRPIAASTIASLRTKPLAEADGVLQM